MASLRNHTSQRSGAVASATQQDSPSNDSGNEHSAGLLARFGIRLEGKGCVIAGAAAAAALFFGFRLLHKYWWQKGPEAGGPEGDNIFASRSSRDLNATADHDQFTNVTGPSQFREHLVHYEGERRTEAAIAAGAPATYFPMPSSYALKRSKQLEERIRHEVDVVLPSENHDSSSFQALMHFFDTVAQSNMNAPTIESLLHAMSSNEKFVDILQSGPHASRGLLARVIVRLERESIANSEGSCTREAFLDIIQQCTDQIEAERQTCRHLLRVLHSNWPANLSSSQPTTSQTSQQPQQDQQQQRIQHSPQQQLRRGSDFRRGSVDQSVQLTPPPRQVREACLSALLCDDKIGSLLAGVSQYVDITPGQAARQASNESQHSSYAYYVNEAHPYGTYTAQHSPYLEHKRLDVSASSHSDGNGTEVSEGDHTPSFVAMPNQRLSKSLALRLALLLALASDSSENADSQAKPSPPAAWVAAALDLVVQSELAQLELSKLFEASKYDEQAASSDVLGESKSDAATDTGSGEWLHVSQFSVDAGLNRGGLSTSAASSFVKVDYNSDDELPESGEHPVQQRVMTDPVVAGVNSSTSQRRDSRASLAARLDYVLSHVNPTGLDGEPPLLTLSLGTSTPEPADAIVAAIAAIEGGWNTQLSSLAQPLRAALDQVHAADTAQLFDIGSLVNHQEEMYEKAVAQRLKAFLQQRPQRRSQSGSRSRK